MYVDFNYVRPEHRQIDGQLINWARWSATHGTRFVQPMFRHYRADESFDDIQGQQRPLPIDPTDALKIERAICKLPENHRRATIWFYRIKVKPVYVCRALGVTRSGLGELITDSRQKLTEACISTRSVYTRAIPRAIA